MKPTEMDLYELASKLIELNKSVFWFMTVDGVGEAQRAWKDFEKALAILRKELDRQYGV